METVFLVCAALGLTLLVCQMVAGLLGLGGDHGFDHDADHEATADHEGNWFLGLLSFRAVAAAVAFFGLGGKIAPTSGATEPAAVGAALAAGAAALYLVALLMQSLYRLQSDGTARVSRAVGRTGSVYLRVPGERAGLGKVHLSLQNRTVEYQAVTAGGELPTGTPVRVVGVVNADTVEVEKC